MLVEEDVKAGLLGRVEHCAFGETKEIVKGDFYAGVGKWRHQSDVESCCSRLYLRYLRATLKTKPGTL